VSRRTERIEDLLRAEISQLILREVHDPRVRLATVASVDVSPDLRQARVNVSVLGDGAQREEVVQALRHARGFIRTQLAHRLRRLRVVPDLDFQLDRGAEYSQHISDLLDHLHDDHDAPDDDRS
jgi:ribosome-binding factor A